MRYLRNIYHFLGSIYFAITLIFTVAILVIIGTLIESKTESHRYAASFTYENPFFVFLLWCFFINILFSASRRWPFRGRHIPFLTAHLGLLMILTGVLIKNYFGIQGTMGIMEGSANDEIFEPGTFVVQAEKYKSQSPQRYELKRHLWGHYYLNGMSDEDLQLEVIGYAPHSYERLQTWIKQDHGSISGLKPFPVYEWKEHTQEKLPISAQSKPWDIYAFRTEHLPQLVREVYLQGMQIRITDRYSEELIYQGPLKDAIQNPIPLAQGEARVSLSFEISPLYEWLNPTLIVKMNSHDQIHIPLTGAESLINSYTSKSYLGQYPLAIDLERTPTLLFIEDEHQDVFLFAFDAYGRVHSQNFQHNALSPIVVYDKGFKGHGVQAEIPFKKAFSRGDLEKSQRDLFVKQLEEGFAEHSQLAPPLDCFKKACEQSQQKFVESCAAFLTNWNHSFGWLYPKHLPLPKPLDEIFSALSFSPQEQKACDWVSRVFQEIELQLREGKEVGQILSDIKWPIEIQKNLDEPSLLTVLTQQIFTVSDLLPSLDQESQVLTGVEKAHLLSAYLRAYGIHWSTIAPTPHIEFESFVLEAPVTAVRKPLIPTEKLENNLPMITLKSHNKHRGQLLTLTYDRFASSFRWPILNGEYLVRFQPQFKRIPYKIRVRSARQVNYANSFQPYSYETDLIITDRRTKVSVEKTISMNHVHETWDGYRFYLANIFPATEAAVKQIQIVVNHDPAKYWLTYPGALILTAGIVLLFWMQPYRKK